MGLLIEKITDISKSYVLSLTAEELNSQLKLTQAETADLFASDALINYRMSRVASRLLLDGDMTADLSLRCGRCLAGFGERLNETFSVALNIVDSPESLEEELELDDEQINAIVQVEGEIDLLPILTEQLFMSLPIHSLCRVDCSGLCPSCGIDLNRNKCTCEPKVFNNRFGKLKGLKLDPS